MLAECDLNCQISLSDIATIGGASELSEQGIKSSLYDKNLRASECIVNRKQWQSASKYPLLFDPQTSGGLIAWVNSQDVSACLQALIAAGYADSKVIGQVIERSNTQQGVDVIVIELV
jgi:selenide,water dikinase